MSRDKFEAWAANEGVDLTRDEDGSYFYPEVCVLYETWLEGRESMRDEAAEKCMKVEADEDYRICIDTDTAVALCLEIKNIEP